ncbi:MAG TPA: hypothetical protein VF889_09040 [Bacteroidota bacterium]
MKHEELIEELHALAAQLGVTIRYERGDFEGGYCILRDQRILLINRRLVPSRKAALLAVAIQQIGLDNVYLKPVVRAYIDDEVAKAARAPH